MNPQQLVTTVVGALLIAAILGLAKWLTSKADKADVVEMKAALAAKADRVELNRVESESKAENAKLEVKHDAAMLVVNQSITRAELTDKLTALMGRADDKTQRILADIVQLFTDSKANAKANADTDKRLDDLPGRVRTLEENQKRS